MRGADPIVQFAFWLGVAVAVLTLVMLSVIIVMRQLVLLREANHARAVARWRPIIEAGTADGSAQVPKLPNRDVPGFIEVWNAVHESLHGATSAHLARIAGETGLEAHLFRVLSGPSFHDRVTALIALGHVKSKESLDRVSQHINDQSPIMSLCAARALLQIDPEQAVPQLVPHIVSRQDWSQGTIATILQETAGPRIAGPLTEATLHANADIAPRLIRFLQGVSPEAARPIIREALTSSADDHMVAACLQLLSNKDDLDSVRPLLQHPRWHVRMQAAVTLGRLGVPGDEKRLMAMLTDEQWWVRYRAAHALVSLTFMKTEQIRHIQKSQTDPYAQDIISHVLAERAIGAAA